MPACKAQMPQGLEVQGQPWWLRLEASTGGAPLSHLLVCPKPHFVEVGVVRLQQGGWEPSPNPGCTADYSGEGIFLLLFLLSLFFLIYFPFFSLFQGARGPDGPVGEPGSRGAKVSASLAEIALSNIMKHHGQTKVPSSSRNWGCPMAP